MMKPYIICREIETLEKSVRFCTCGRRLKDKKAIKSDYLMSHTVIRHEGVVQSSDFSVYEHCPNCGERELILPKTVEKIDISENDNHLTIHISVANLLVDYEEKYKSYVDHYYKEINYHIDNIALYKQSFFSHGDNTILPFQFKKELNDYTFVLYKEEGTCVLLNDKGENFLSSIDISSILPLYVLDKINALLFKEKNKYTYENAKTTYKYDESSGVLFKKEQLMQSIINRSMINSIPNNHFFSPKDETYFVFSDVEWQEKADHANNLHDFMKLFAPAISKKAAHKIRNLFNHDFTNWSNKAIELITLSVFTKPETINNLINTIAEMNKAISETDKNRTSFLSISPNMCVDSFLMDELLNAETLREKIQSIMPLEKLDNHMNRILAQQDFGKVGVENVIQKANNIAKFSEYLLDTATSFILLENRLDLLWNRLTTMNEKDLGYAYLIESFNSIKDTLQNKQHKSIYTAHDELSNVYAETVHNFYVFDTSKHIEINYPEYRFKLVSPKNTEELIRYGRDQMHICAVNYNDTLAKDRHTQLLFLVDSDDEAHVCVELFTMFGYSINQVKKKYNKLITNEEEDTVLRLIISKFIEENDCQLRTADLSDVSHFGHLVY